MVSKKKLLKIEKLKRKARDLSIKESIYAWGRDSFGDKFVAPFAIAINSTNSMVALLSAVTGLLGPLFQLFGSRLPEQYPRKKIILKTVFYESLMWLPFIAIAILFYFNIIPEMLPYLLLFSFSLVTIFLHLGHPAWFSWMGDIINEKDRGRWFAKRSLIGGFVSIILTILASGFLDYFKSKGWIMFGFLTLILIASLIGGISWAGFDLVARNFVYDNVRRENRGLIVSYYNLLIGIGTFLGAGLGAFLIKFLTVSFIEPIVLIFILDSLLRMAVVFYWVPKIKEVKETKKLSRRKIKNLLFKQTKPILMEEVQQIMSIKEYMEKK